MRQSVLLSADSSPNTAEARNLELPWHPMWVAVTHVVGPSFAAFPGAVTGSWVGSRKAMSETDPPVWNVSVQWPVNALCPPVWNVGGQWPVNALCFVFKCLNVSLTLPFLPVASHSLFPHK